MSQCSVRIQRKLQACSNNYNHHIYGIIDFVTCFVITDAIHHTFSTSCYRTAASSLDNERALQHPRNIGAHFKARTLFLTPFLLYDSSALKSVDQIQHPHTRAWPIRARRGWSRDGGPWGQRPISVSGWLNKGSASANVGRLNGTLFMSTLRSFKEARRGDIAEFRVYEREKKMFAVPRYVSVRRCKGMRMGMTWYSRRRSTSP